MPTFRELLAQAKSAIHEVDAAEADSRRGEALFLDVREPEEYEQGAVPDALHIPRGNLETQVEGRVSDHDRPIVVYCASGYRSAIAVSLLRRDGMPKVANLVGGLAGWNAAQLRTVAARSDPPTKLMVSWLA